MVNSEIKKFEKIKKNHIKNRIKSEKNHIAILCSLILRDRLHSLNLEYNNLVVKYGVRIDAELNDYANKLIRKRIESTAIDVAKIIEQIQEGFRKAERIKINEMKQLEHRRLNSELETSYEFQEKLKKIYLKKTRQIIESPKQKEVQRTKNFTNDKLKSNLTVAPDEVNRRVKQFRNKVIKTKEFKNIAKLMEKVCASEKLKKTYLKKTQQIDEVNRKVKQIQEVQRMKNFISDKLGSNLTVVTDEANRKVKQLRNKIIKTKEFKNIAKQMKKSYALVIDEMQRDVKSTKSMLKINVERDEIIRKIELQHIKDIQYLVAKFRKQIELDYKKIQTSPDSPEKDKALAKLQESISSFYDYLNEFNKKFHKKFTEKMMIEFL